MIVGGTADQYFDAAAFEETARRIPVARLELFDGETHMLPVERRRDVARVVAEFLKTEDAARFGDDRRDEIYCGEGTFHAHPKTSWPTTASSSSHRRRGKRVRRGDPAKKLGHAEPASGGSPVASAPRQR